jgi:hypothetical protein
LRPDFGKINESKCLERRPQGEKDEECPPETLSKIIDELEKDKRGIYAGCIGGHASAAGADMAALRRERP